MTTITHNGKQARLRAEIGEFITETQAKRALKAIGGKGHWFVGDNGVQIFKLHNGPFVLRQLSPDQVAAVREASNA